MQFQLGGDIVEPTRLPKSARDYGNSHILHIDPTASNSTVSTPHVRNMGSPWDQLPPTRPPTWAQLVPNFGPTSSTRLGATSAQVRSTLHQNGGHGRPDPKHSKNAFSLVFPPCCVSVGARSSRQRVPTCAMLSMTWASMCLCGRRGIGSIDLHSVWQAGSGGALGFC